MAHLLPFYILLMAPFKLLKCILTSKDPNVQKVEFLWVGYIFCGDQNQNIALPCVPLSLSLSLSPSFIFRPTSKYLKQTPAPMEHAGKAHFGKSFMTLVMHPSAVVLITYKDVFVICHTQGDTDKYISSKLTAH